jgi:type VI secretion system secreted protein VgrG
VQAQKDLRQLVKHDEAHTVGRNQDLVVKGVKKERIGSDSHLIVSGAQNAKVTGKDSLEAGSHEAKIDGRYAVSSGNEVRLEGGESLTIKGPGGFIKIDERGITIQGTLVEINCGGVDMGQPASPTDPSEADEVREGGS